MPAFRDGDRHYIIRFAPTEAGNWDYRLTSNLPRLNGQTGSFSAGSFRFTGVRAHHQGSSLATENGKPHLWMATAIEGFTKLPRAEFDRIVDQPAKEKFTHLRVPSPRRRSK